MSESRLRFDGLYWVRVGKEWTAAKYKYLELVGYGCWKIPGCDGDYCDDDFEEIGASIHHSASQAVSVIAGSKYNYTEKSGDSMINLGFDALEELRDYLRFANRE